MKAQLTYFTEAGKYYAQGELDVGNRALWLVFAEVQRLADARRLPGLVVNHSPFFVHVNVAGHPHEHPALVIPRSADGEQYIDAHGVVHGCELRKDGGCGHTEESARTCPDYRALHAFRIDR